MRSDGAGPQHPAMGESVAHPAEGLSQGQQRHQQVRGPEMDVSQGNTRWMMVRRVYRRATELSKINRVKVSSCVLSLLLISRGHVAYNIL